MGVKASKQVCQQIISVPKQLQAKLLILNCAQFSASYSYRKKVGIFSIQKICSDSIILGRFQAS